jgi:hypothetical protein
MFPFSSDVAKSLVNRLESALGKEGSPSARLRMASSSLLAQSDKLDAESQDASMLLALGSFLVIASEIAKDNTPAPSTTTPKAPKATREKWFDADSDEARAITTPKPRTKKNASVPVIADEILALLVQAINASK